MKKPPTIIHIGFILILITILAACTTARGFSATGTVSEIVRGKDGYTATLTTKSGGQFDAVISRVNLANTSEYQELNIGDKVTVYGDTTRLGDRISIKVNQIKN